MAHARGVDAYIAEIKKRSKYRATWLPTTTVTPGDIGRLDGQRFVVETSLAALGISFTVVAGDAEADYEFSSSTVRVQAQAAARLTVAAAPAMTLRAEFRDAGGFLFAAYDCASHRIQRIDVLKEDVLRLYGDGRWDRDWLIATEVVTAESLITLISASAGAFAEIDSRAALTAGPVAITSLRDALRLGTYSGLDYRVVARRRVTPMFIAHRLTGWPRSLNPRGGTPAPDPGESLDLRQVLP
ncbi:MAG: hypothetical protein ACLPQY_05585 [Streptosporangiaceae bacterium]